MVREGVGENTRTNSFAMRGEGCSFTQHRRRSVTWRNTAGSRILRVRRLRFGESALSSFHAQPFDTPSWRAARSWGRSAGRRHGALGDSN